ncbi:LacI family DNA-binding transcriptional regulator [Azospirillum picis]|uniref:LacI family gluconate utilization system Gnt-I transcriptional repressor n=1 Tax=Azospirillum picis TaxID=488438 RepID=A0ABU0MML9_9PROT|nr:LacI family DNA-binding transcriptional regulator [Azospirillum picis]MBP2300620.1 LacI family gluconate utilization system Gnt-I transcriptional repressor [Azospirillum picis]MDQ0534589.1 LacI family gluconate utilization system Gnt-I transcriptional repressor [Azospirillum picis]
MTDTGAEKRPPTIDDVVRVAKAEPELPAEDGAVREGTAPPRIVEIARLAGVSPITVSRALRQPEKVAEAKRRKILEIVERTGYATNPHARALRSGQSNIVAAFVSNIQSQQFCLAVQGCGEVLEPQGYQLMIGQTSYSYAKETTMIQSLREMRPAAVMFTGVIEIEENRRALRALGIPIMETWAYPRDPIDMLVGFSNIDGGRLAAEHFAGRGYRRVAFIGRRSGRGALRLSGFREGAHEAGLDIVAELSVDGVSSMVDGRRALGDLLSRDASVQAVFCANDLLATGALLEARRRGMRLPDDIAILGFGHQDIADELPPGLTTVGIDSRDLGRRAGQLILQRMRSETPDSLTQVVDLTLAQRGSS